MWEEETHWRVCCAQGYFLGAFLFLGIVFSLPATLGMASLALNLPVRQMAGSHDKVSRCMLWNNAAAAH